MRIAGQTGLLVGLLFALGVLFAPVSVNVVTDNLSGTSRGSLSYAGDKKIELESRSLPDDNHLRISVDSAASENFSFVIESIRTKVIGWLPGKRCRMNGKRLDEISFIQNLSLSNGDVLLCRMPTSGGYIWLKAKSGEGEVRANWNSFSHSALLGDSSKKAHFAFSSPRKLLHARLPIWRLSHPLIIQTSSEILSAELRIGEVRLANKDKPGGREISFELNLFSDIGKALLSLFANMAKLFGSVFLLLVFFSIVGDFVFGICALRPSSLPVHLRFLFPAVGYSLVVCMGVLFSFGYLRSGLIAFTLCVVAVARYLSVHNKTFFTALAEDIDSFRPLGRDLIFAFAAITVSMLPVFWAPTYFAGHWYTDIFWYVNVSTIVSEHGFSLYTDDFWTRNRRGDLSSIHAVAWLFGKDSLAAFQSHGGFLFLLASLCGSSLLRAAVSKPRIFQLLPFTALAPLVALFQHNYLSQFIQVVALLIAISAHRQVFSCKDFKLIFPISLIWALSLNVYPYFFVYPLAALISILLWRDNDLSQKLKIWLGLAVVSLTLACRSIGLLFTTHSKAEASIRLNEIGREFVFPFYQDWEQVLIYAGFLDFSRISTFVARIAGSFSAEWLVSTEILRLPAGFLILMFCFYVSGRAVAYREEARMLLFCFLLLVCAAVSALLIGEVYPYGKFLLTAGVVFVVLSCIGLALQIEKRPRLGALMAFVFVALQLTTILWEHSPYFFNQRDAMLRDLRTNVGVVDYETFESLRAIETIEAEGCSKALFLGEMTEFAGMDGDRVYGFLLWLMFSNYDIHSASDLRLKWFGANFHQDISAQEQADLLLDEKLCLVLQYLGDDNVLPEGFKEHASSELFTLWLREPST